MRLRSLQLCLVLAALWGTGCGDLSRFRECQQVADTANPALEQIEQLGLEAKNPTSRLYQQVADRYAELKKAIQALAVSDSKLNSAVTEYSAMLGLTEKQLRQSGKSLGSSKNKQEHLDRHQKSMAPILAQQQTTLTRIRGLCKP